MELHGIEVNDDPIPIGTAAWSTRHLNLDSVSV